MNLEEKLLTFNITIKTDKKIITDDVKAKNYAVAIIEFKDKYNIVEEELVCCMIAKQ